MSKKLLLFFFSLALFGVGATPTQQTPERVFFTIDQPEKRPNFVQKTGMFIFKYQLKQLSQKELLKTAVCSLIKVILFKKQKNLMVGDIINLSLFSKLNAKEIVQILPYKLQSILPYKLESILPYKLQFFLPYKLQSILPYSNSAILNALIMVVILLKNKSIMKEIEKECRELKIQNPFYYARFPNHQNTLTLRSDLSQILDIIFYILPFINEIINFIITKEPEYTLNLKSLNTDSNAKEPEYTLNLKSLNIDTNAKDPRYNLKSLNIDTDSDNKFLFLYAMITNSMLLIDLFSKKPQIPYETLIKLSPELQKKCYTMTLI